MSGCLGFIDVISFNCMLLIVTVYLKLNSYDLATFVNW